MISHLLPVALIAPPHLGEVVLPRGMETKDAILFVDPLEDVMHARIVQVGQNKLVQDWLAPFCH